MEEAGVSHGAKQREAAPQSAKAFCALPSSSSRSSTSGTDYQTELSLPLNSRAQNPQMRIRLNGL